MLAILISLIHQVEKYCGHSTELEKKIKFSILSPISEIELNDLSEKFVKITQLH